MISHDKREQRGSKNQTSTSLGKNSKQIFLKKTSRSESNDLFRRSPIKFKRILFQGGSSFSYPGADSDWGGGGVSNASSRSFHNNQPSQGLTSGTGFSEYNEGTQLQQF